MVWKWIAVVVCGYILGSVNIAIIITRFLMHNDVRKTGSGNAGAANVARVFGPLMGFVTLSGDIIKTVAAMLVGSALLGEAGLCVAGAACMIGHCFPVFFGFKGGKGVSVAAGIALMVNWRLALICLAIYVATVLTTRRASVGSLAGVTAIPIAHLIAGASSPTVIALTAFAALMVWFMHRTNIKRLVHGEEKPFTFGKKK